MASNNTNDIIIYQNPDGTSALEVHLDRETVWLTQKSLAEPFAVQVPAINKLNRKND